jgi:hypothetical protein
VPPGSVPPGPAPRGDRWFGRRRLDGHRAAGERQLGQPGALLVLGERLDAESGVQGAQVTLDRVHAQEDLVGDLLIRGRRREGALLFERAAQGLEDPLLRLGQVVAPVSHPLRLITHNTRGPTRVAAGFVLTPRC